MIKYVLFLRGINIGGRNLIQMSSLKNGLVEIGLSDVYTYINSGNILFTSRETNRTKLIKQIQSMIFLKFNLEISMVLLTVDELKNKMDHAPIWWNDHNKDYYHTMIFLIGDMTIENVCQAMKEPLDGLEKVFFYENVIYWSVVLKTYNKSRWSKIASSPINGFVTMRTANTINKIIELSYQLEVKR